MFTRTNAFFAPSARILVAANQCPHRCQHLTFSTLFGGIDESSFRKACEGSSTFIKEVLAPKIDRLNKDQLTMILPFKQDFIGNPLIPCLHGGIAASMLDHTASSCATAALEDANLYLVTSGMYKRFLHVFEVMRSRTLSY